MMAPYSSSPSSSFSSSSSFSFRSLFVRALFSFFLLSVFDVTVTVTFVSAQCASFPTVLNGVTSCNGTGTSAWNVCTVNCNAGHFMTAGNATHTCQPSGQWTNGLSVTCTAIFCPVLTAPAGVSQTCSGPFDGATPMYGATCQYSCADTRTQYLSGNFQRNCTQFSNWTSATPSASFCNTTNFITHARSVCELPNSQSPAAPFAYETCQVCNTLLFDSFDVNPLSSSGWFVETTAGVVGTPSWTLLTVNGATTVRQTTTSLTCSVPTAAQCTTTALVYGYSGWNWYNYKVRVRLAYSTSTAGMMGVAFNYQNLRNTYEYVIQANTRILRYKLNGVNTNLWSTTVVTAVNSFVNIEVEYRYGLIRVWNDGVLVGNPVYDATFTKGTVALLNGGGVVAPIFDYITVQQPCYFHRKPYSYRVFVGADDNFVFYVDGVPQSWSGRTYIGGHQAIGEFTIPYNPSATLAVTAYNTGGGGAWIQLRSPWAGVETFAGANGGWQCAAGENPAWVTPGYNISNDPAGFWSLGVTVSNNARYGQFYSAANTNPPGLWNNANVNLNTTITCILQGINAKTSMPPPTPSILSSVSLAPQGPYPFDYSHWDRVDPYLYSGGASMWNWAGSGGQPGGAFALGSGNVLDTYSASGNFFTYSDQSQQGTKHVYRHAYGFTSYDYSVMAGSCTNSALGIVWNFVNNNNYYELIQHFSLDYVAVRKWVNGVAATLYINLHVDAFNTRWYQMGVTVRPDGWFNVTFDGSVLYTDIIDADVRAQGGTVGVQSINNGCAYFYNTTLRFWQAAAGDQGNLGVWSHSNTRALNPLGYVTESSGAGHTMYSFPNWQRALDNSPHWPEQAINTMGWVLRVQTSLSAFPGTPSEGGVWGIDFYRVSADSYYQLVIDTTTTVVSLNVITSGVRSVLCSGVVTASVTADVWRTLAVQSRSSVFSVYVDNEFLCSASDPTSFDIHSLPPINLVSNITTNVAGSVQARFQNLRFEYVPTTAQDTGPAGTGTCTCSNGGSCVAGLTWGSSVCTCVAGSGWTGSSCDVTMANLTASTVTGNGTTGGGVGSSLVVNVTLANTTVDSTYVSRTRVTVRTTNVFGNIASEVVLPVVWSGAGTTSFLANYTVQFTGTVTVWAEVLSGGVWTSVGVPSPQSYNVSTGSLSQSNWAVLGAGVTGTTINTVSPIILIAQDASGNEVQGQSSWSLNFAATITFSNGSGLVLPVTYSGVGGRFTASYTPPVAGDAVLSISYSGTPLPGSPFTVPVFAIGTLTISSPASTKTPIRFYWTPPNASQTSGQTVLYYGFLMSEENTFANLASARYPSPPEASDPLVIYFPKATATYYLKVTFTIRDPANPAATVTRDLSASNYVLA